MTDGIVTESGHGFQRHAASALYGPLVVSLDEDGADETDDRRLVREDSDDFRATLDFAVQTFDRIGRVPFRPVLLGEGRVGGNWSCPRLAGQSAYDEEVRMNSQGALRANESETRSPGRLDLRA